MTDTSIGIAPEDHDAVFEEFRQVGAADNKAEGTGLGLALPTDPCCPRIRAAAQEIADRIGAAVAATRS